VARSNDEVAQRLEELARLTVVDEGDPNSFRVRAYQNAARAVQTLDRDVAQLSTTELTKVKGLGKATAAKIRQFLDEGRIDKLDALRAKYPPGQLELMRVPGLGPKSIQLLAEVLDVRDLDGLKAAIDDGRLADLPGMGEKTAANLAVAIEQMHLASKERRRPIHEALPVAERLVATLEARDDVQRVAYAGSLRRFRDTIGDVDILVAATAPAGIMEAFTTHDAVSRVQGHGDTKSSVVTHDGLQVDLRVVPPEAFGAALVYFTGSKAHNIRLRQRAIARGWKLSEYTLEDAETGALVAGATEQDVYAALDLDWIHPEQREDNGEIEVHDRTDPDTSPPRLVELDDLRGDLHDHTTWSGDGRSSLPDMVAAAATRGHAYFAITDHAEDLRINGISREQMLEQRRILRQLQEQVPDTRLLHGAELNIGIDGSVDYDPEFLAGYDWLVASVHSHFRRPVAEQTHRIVTAMRNPAITAIGHLSGRKLGHRPGIELDLDAVFDAAIETGTAIEINSDLHRLDATAEVIREGAARGVRFVISTDAHHTRELDFHRHGVRQARRGGVPADQVVNTWDVDRFLAWVDDVHTA
jgi:DNA polymerase (family 10)